MSDTWFFILNTIKQSFLKQSFCFFFIPQFHFYMAHTSFLQHTKMFDLDDIINENNKNHDKKWPYTPDHPNRMLIIGGSGSGKKNALLNLIK